jgi:16S rRNA (guanine966-N2)-methyltransferase
MAKQRSTKAKRHSHQGVRIIAGQWRGQRIAVVPGTSLRPTPDRVRETVFNWLSPTIAGSRCLDLFAGSGALGWEALSRGAAAVTFVERDRSAVVALGEHQAQFAAANATVVHADAGAWLQAVPQAFDLVFLDPPYGEPLQPWLEQLATGWLSPTAIVYVERKSQQALDACVDFAGLYRRSRAGGVHYGLLRHGQPPSG